MPHIQRVIKCTGSHKKTILDCVVNVLPNFLRETGPSAALRSMFPPHYATQTANKPACFHNVIQILLSEPSSSHPPLSATAPFTDRQWRNFSHSGAFIKSKHTHVGANSFASFERRRSFFFFSCCWGGGADSPTVQ